MNHTDRAKARRIANSTAEPVAIYTTIDDFEPKIVCMCLARQVNDDEMEVIEIIYPVQDAT